MAGSGRSTAVAGSKAEFTVTFRDAFGNPCCNKDTGHGSQGLALEVSCKALYNVHEGLSTDELPVVDGQHSAELKKCLSYSIFVHCAVLCRAVLPAGPVDWQQHHHSRGC